MKAISIRNPWAELIARGEKEHEFRTWKIAHRGPLLVVSSKERDKRAPAIYADLEPAFRYGVAICVVDMVDVVRRGGLYAWVLAHPRRVEPVPVKGSAAIYHVDDKRIRL